MEIYGTLQAKNNINGSINVASLGGGGGTSDFDTKIIPYANRISKNEEDIISINDAIENHTEQISTNTENLMYLESEVDTNTQSISNLNTSVNNVNQTVSQHSTDINNLFTFVSNGKQLLASAITDKGVETEASDSFETMAQNIANIMGGFKGEIYFESWNLYNNNLDGILIKNGQVYKVPKTQLSNYSDYLYMYVLGYVYTRVTKPCHIELYCYENSYQQWYESKDVEIDTIISQVGGVKGWHNFLIVTDIE